MRTGARSADERVAAESELHWEKHREGSECGKVVLPSFPCEPLFIRLSAAPRARKPAGRGCGAGMFCTTTVLTVAPVLLPAAGGASSTSSSPVTLRRGVVLAVTTIGSDPTTLEVVLVVVVVVAVAVTNPEDEATAAGRAGLGMIPRAGDKVPGERGVGELPRERSEGGGVSASRCSEDAAGDAFQSTVKSIGCEEQGEKEEESARGA